MFVLLQWSLDTETLKQTEKTPISVKKSEQEIIAEMNIFTLGKHREISAINKIYALDLPHENETIYFEVMEVIAVVKEDN